MATAGETPTESSDEIEIEASELLLNEQFETLSINSTEESLTEQVEILSPNAKYILEVNDELATYYLEEHKYDKAVEVLEVIYDTKMDTLGPYNLDTIAARRKLVHICREYNFVEKALNVLRNLYNRMLFEFGPDHEGSEFTLLEIGVIQLKLEKYEDAYKTFNRMSKGLEQQYLMARELRDRDPEKAVEFFEKICTKLYKERGANHLDTLTAKFRLGKALAATKSLAKTKRGLLIVEDVLRKRLFHLGKGHETTLSTSRHLALMVYKMGKEDLALQLLYDVCFSANRRLGADNRQNIKAQTEIIRILCSKHKYYKALQVYTDMFVTQTGNKPENKEAFKNAVNTKVAMGDIYSKIRDFRQASLAYYEAAKLETDENEKARLERKGYILRLRDNADECLRDSYKDYGYIVNVYGPDEPEAFDAIEKIGEAHKHLKMYDSALINLKNVYYKRRRLLGKDHVATFRALLNLGDVYARLGAYFQSMFAYRDVHVARKYVHLDAHIYYGTTNYAAMLCMLGMYEESLVAYEQRLCMRIPEDETDALFEEDKNDPIFEPNIALALAKQGGMTVNSIINAFRKLFDVAISWKGPEYPVNIIIQDNIAKFLRMDKKFQEALEAYKTVEHLLNIQPSFDYNGITLLSTKHSIADMYAHLNRTLEAVRVRAEIYQSLKSTVGDEDPNCVRARLDLARDQFYDKNIGEAYSFYMDVYRETIGKLKYKFVVVHDWFVRADIKHLPKSKITEKVLEQQFDTFIATLRGKDLSYINRQDSTGATALHYAVEGHIAYVRALIRAGASYDIEDQAGKTPIDYASNTECASLLHEIHNFFIAVKLCEGDFVATVIDHDKIFLSATDKEGKTALEWACLKQDLKIIKMLLDYAVVYYLPRGRTVSNILNATENEAIIKLLHDYEKGETGSKYISAGIFEKKGDTPLHYAARNGQLETLNYLLLEKGDPTIGNFYGYTPLHYAAFDGHFKIVEALLEHIKNTDAKKLKKFVNRRNTIDGTTALHLACNKGFKDIYDLLVENGADVFLKTSVKKK